MPDSRLEATARQRIRDILRAEPDGLSKSELKRRVGGNAGAFRRLIRSMVDTGEVVTEMEDRPHCGPTRVHRLAPEVADAA